MSSYSLTCTRCCGVLNTNVSIFTPNLNNRNQNPKEDALNQAKVYFLSTNQSDCIQSLDIEARGFIFGPPIALAIGAKFVPFRKPGKRPGEVITEDYVLEYAKDCLEMHVEAVEPKEQALVVDDLIATGGTLCAAMNLLEQAGAEVVECACVIVLPDLKGHEWLKGKPLYVLLEAH